MTSKRNKKNFKLKIGDVVEINNKALFLLSLNYEKVINNVMKLKKCSLFYNHEGNSVVIYANNIKELTGKDNEKCKECPLYNDCSYQIVILNKITEYFFCSRLFNKCAK